MPHPWKNSRPGWTGLWATWSGWRYPCSLQEGWTRWPLKVPSKQNYSMILSCGQILVWVGFWGEGLQCFSTAVCCNAMVQWMIACGGGSVHYCCLLPGHHYSGPKYEVYKQEFRTSMKWGVTWLLQRIITFWVFLRFVPLKAVVMFKMKTKATALQKNARKK